MNEERIPAEVFPLAEYLADEMTARGWQTEDVAARMDGQEFIKDLLCLDILMCVHDDQMLIGDELFGGLAHAFDVNEDYLRNLDRTWRENPDKRVPFKPPESLFGPISRSCIREPS
jgi:hypothetical protein